MKNFNLDGARIHVFNLGDLYYPLTRINSVPESEWRPAHSYIYENKLPYPMLSIYIVSREQSVLVDAGDYSLMAPIGSEFRPEGYVPPPKIVEQLQDISVYPDEIDSVVITHNHWDHYAGLTTRKADGSYVPTFPKARHYIGRGDWESQKVQNALEDPNSNDSHTLGVLQKRGLLELVDETAYLSSDIRIIHYPGESPGHQIVRLEYSAGHVFYCTGDLFHHPVEIEHVAWMAKWDDPQVMINSRKKFIQTALAENALFQGGHMPLGIIGPIEGGAHFVETDSTESEFG